IARDINLEKLLQLECCFRGMCAVLFINHPNDQHKQVLTCLATSFYPRDIEMNIRLNQAILKDQISSGIRPNGNGSFQMSARVEIDRNHKGSYDCLVNHSSLTEPRSHTTDWDLIVSVSDVTFTDR
uniref:Immunoglobulin C1-set domain-containing protein n=1 Tax=Sinocyclocheilus grahami TaxID=75366 RepID=A0A672LQZ8_SINGR